MYIRPIAAIAILFVFHPLVLTANDLPHPANSQSEPAITNKTSSGENTSMSDREKVGLRGPVQQCTEERTTPAFENFPGTSYVSISKYSPEGTLLQTSIGNSVESAQESLLTPMTPPAACSEKPPRILVRPRQNQIITTTKKDESSASPETRSELPPSSTTIMVAKLASCRHPPPRSSPKALSTCFPSPKPKIRSFPSPPAAT